jgi:hypothetical protein
MQPVTHALPHEPGHAPGHDAHHDAPNFWRTYIFSVDHKTIGVQYAITGLCFMFLGFLHHVHDALANRQAGPTDPDLRTAT